jgi:hypothetical protein
VEGKHVAISTLLGRGKILGRECVGGRDQAGKEKDITAPRSQQALSREFARRNLGYFASRFSP